MLSTNVQGLNEDSLSCLHAGLMKKKKKKKERMSSVLFSHAISVS